MSTITLQIYLWKGICWLFLSWEPLPLSREPLPPSGVSFTSPQPCFFFPPLILTTASFHFAYSYGSLSLIYRHKAADLEPLSRANLPVSCQSLIIIKGLKSSWVFGSCSIVFNYTIVWIFYITKFANIFLYVMCSKTTSACDKLIMNAKISIIFLISRTCFFIWKRIFSQKLHGFIFHLQNLDFMCGGENHLGEKRTWGGGREGNVSSFHTYIKKAEMKPVILCN